MFRSVVVMREVDKGMKALRRTLDNVRLKDAYVKAGVIGAPAAKKHGDADFTNVDVAVANEFGTAKIPERSFVRGSFEQHREEYNSLLRAMLPKVYETKMTPDQVLGLLGARMAADMKNGIKAGILPPNAESTLRRKLAKTYGGAAAGDPKPLIDTGQLLNSITWAVTVNGHTEQFGGATAGSMLKPKTKRSRKGSSTVKKFKSQVRRDAKKLLGKGKKK